MKTKYVFLAAALFVSAITFAQKDELKTLKKIFEKETISAKDVIEYKAAILAAEPLIASSAVDSDKIYFSLFKASQPAIAYSEALTKPENAKDNNLAIKFFTPETIDAIVKNYLATKDFEKKTGKQTLTKKIDANSIAFKPTMVNYAVVLGNENKYKESSLILYNLYLLDNKDVDKLYYAAGYATNGKDYDAALNYYNELIKLNYSGEATVYYAKSKVNGNEENFSNKADRDNMVKFKTHDTPRDEKIPSKRGEIVKNIGLIYQIKGNVAEAKRVIKEAVKLNPDDSSLALTEANLYLETKDYDAYKSLISEILAKNPTNAELYYNLGVISYNNKSLVDAEKYYKKAVEIDPKYGNAYLNLAILKLDAEKEIIAKMNKLGNTPADNKKYDELKVQRNGLFTNALPYLEKAVELDETNKDAAKTLLSVYNALEIMDKAKILKAKIGAAK